MRDIHAGRLTRREALRAAGAGAAILTLPGLAGACGGGSSTDTRRGVGGKASDEAIASLTWGVGEAPPTLDIATGYTGSGTMAMLLGLEGLVRIGEDLKVQPLLAESWTQPDPLHYSYKIRRGVIFWDGSPLTVDDVVFSLRRHLDPKTASQLSAYFVNVDSVDQTAADEVTVTLKRPDPLFQYVPTLTLVTPKRFSERLGEELGTPGPRVNTMGTGPYKITSFSTDDGLTFERRDDYWGAKPRVRNAKLSYIGDAQTRLLALRSGDVHGVSEPDFPLEQSRQWDRIAAVNTDYAAGVLVVFLAFNVEEAPWDDIHVRRAIAHAVDREGYVRAFLAGHGTPATSVVPPAIWKGLADQDRIKDIYSRIPQYEHDIEKARAELAQSRHRDGFSAEISVPQVQPAFAKAMVSLGEALQQIGITLRVKEVPLEEWGAALYAHEDLGLTFSWSGPGPNIDPASYPTSMFDSAKAVPNQFNTAHYKNPEVDRLLREQAETTDNDVRVQLLAETLRIVGEDLPYLPLWWPDTAIALNERFVFQHYNNLPLTLTSGWMTRVAARA